MNELDQKNKNFLTWDTLFSVNPDGTLASAGDPFQIAHEGRQVPAEQRLQLAERIEKIASKLQILDKALTEKKSSKSSLQQIKDVLTKLMKSPKEDPEKKIGQLILQLEKADAILSSISNQMSQIDYQISWLSKDIEAFFGHDDINLSEPFTNLLNLFKSISQKLTARMELVQNRITRLKRENPNYLLLKTLAERETKASKPSSSATNIIPELADLSLEQRNLFQNSVLLNMVAVLLLSSVINVGDFFGRIYESIGDQFDKTGQTNKEEADDIQNSINYIMALEVDCTQNLAQLEQSLDVIEEICGISENSEPAEDFFSPEEIATINEYRQWLWSQTHQPEPLSGDGPPEDDDDLTARERHLQGTLFPPEVRETTPSGDVLKTYEDDGYTAFLNERRGGGAQDIFVPRADVSEEINTALRANSGLSPVLASEAPLGPDGYFANRNMPETGSPEQTSPTLIGTAQFFTIENSDQVDQIVQTFGQEVSYADVVGLMASLHQEWPEGEFSPLQALYQVESDYNALLENNAHLSKENTSLVFEVQLVNDDLLYFTWTVRVTQEIQDGQNTIPEFSQVVMVDAGTPGNPDIQPFFMVDQDGSNWKRAILIIPVEYFGEMAGVSVEFVEVANNLYPVRISGDSVEEGYEPEMIPLTTGVISSRDGSGKVPVFEIGQQTLPTSLHELSDNTEVAVVVAVPTSSGTYYVVDFGNDTLGGIRVEDVDLNDPLMPSIAAIHIQVGELTPPEGFENAFFKPFQPPSEDSSLVKMIENGLITNVQEFGLATQLIEQGEFESLEEFMAAREAVMDDLYPTDRQLLENALRSDKNSFWFDGTTFTDGSFDFISRELAAQIVQELLDKQTILIGDIGVEIDLTTIQFARDTSEDWFTLVVSDTDGNPVAAWFSDTEEWGPPFEGLDFSLVSTVQFQLSLQGEIDRLETEGITEIPDGYRFNYETSRFVDRDGNELGGAESSSSSYETTLSGNRIVRAENGLSAEDTVTFVAGDQEIIRFAPTTDASQNKLEWFGPLNDQDQLKNVVVGSLIYHYFEQNHIGEGKPFASWDEVMAAIGEDWEAGGQAGPDWTTGGQTEFALTYQPIIQDIYDHPENYIYLLEGVTFKAARSFDGFANNAQMSREEFNTAELIQDGGITIVGIDGLLFSGLEHSYLESSEPLASWTQAGSIGYFVENGQVFVVIDVQQSWADAADIMSFGTIHQLFGRNEQNGTAGPEILLQYFIPEILPQIEGGSDKDWLTPQ